MNWPGLLLLATAVAGAGNLRGTMAMQEPVPPVARKIPHELPGPDGPRIDEYYWMRERENPEVIAWLTAENAYTDAVLTPQKALRERLADELRQRIPQDDESVPWPDRGWLWYRRTENGRQYPIWLRRRMSVPDAIPETVVDVNRLAEGHGFCSLSNLAIAPNGNLVAWAVDLVGRRKYTIQFRDLATGQMLADQIVEVTPDMTWSEDGSTLFYVRQDPETLRSYQVFAHRVGTDAATDRLVYEEADEEFSVGLRKSRSRKFIFIESDQTLSTEARILDAHQPDAAPVVFLPRSEDHEYHVDHLGDRFVIRTNRDAPNFRLMTASGPGTPESDWQELLPHDPERLTESFELFDRWLVVEQWENGLTRIRFRRWGDQELRTLDLGEPCYEAGLSVTPDPSTDRVRMIFSSLRTPDSTFEVDLGTLERTVLKTERIGGGFDRNNYVTERLWAPAADGTLVPVSLLRRSTTPVDASAPCLLYAYGSYGASMSAGFDAAVLSLVDRGFVYAIAHIRGGQEMGRHWYEDGKLLRKKNTFTDFIDSARFLVAQKFADPRRLYASGGSAGGLLMGAVANMAPDLFHGIIAEVPFVDVVTTMQDPTIPLTTSEYDEWGNPADPEYFRYMLSYSPYDNVMARDYPNMLVTTGLHDSQVQYWEPAKWVARLRERKTDRNLLLLRTEMEAGHGGASGRYDQYAEIALQQAFLLRLAGIAQ